MSNDKKVEKVAPVENEEEKSATDQENEQNSEEGSENESEYDIIDVTDDPLYQVLSAFFETEEGDNLCDILKDLSNAVRENTKTMNKILKSKSNLKSNSK